jgi:replicative DNA helicase
MIVNTKKDLSTLRRKPDLSAMVYGKIPPQAPEMETAVLGAIMLEKDKLEEVFEIIQDDNCFYVDAHRKIFAAIRSLANSGSPIDLLTVTEELRKRNELEIVGGAYYLTTLTLNVVSSAHVEAHARIVMEKFVQRELIRISGEVIADAYEDSTDVFDLLDKAEAGLYEITDKHLRKNYKSLNEVLMQTMQEIEEALNQHSDLTGVPSGFAALDKLTGGWQRSDLIVLAARPSVGKTAFALNLIMNAAMNREKPFAAAIFSLEMGAGSIVKRMLSAVTEVRMEGITKGRLEAAELKQIQQRMNLLAKAPIFIDDQAGLNVFELRAKARRLKQKHDLQLIIIDYLQLMQGSSNNGGNREQEISKISRDLKMLAKELDIPIIALSQLNRSVESRKESKVPQLSDLRESGAIEQDADLVMFLYRPEYYGLNNNEKGEAIEGETHIHVAKHRNGQLDNIRVKFLGHFQKFVEIEDAGGFNPFADNPQAGIRKDPSDFSGSKMFIAGPPPTNSYTLPSKANDMNWDEDDLGVPPFKPNNEPEEEPDF